jgi:hypothetical protein
MRKSGNGLGRSLRFEQLEDRNLLAGNVTAAVAGGTLNIVGDNSANVLQLTQVGTNRWQVLGAGTKVNGSYSAKTFSGVTNIAADLNGGSDSILVYNGALNGTLGIVTDGGNDAVTLSNVRAAAVGVSTGDGHDSLSFAKVTAPVVQVATGNGNDSVSLVRVGSRTSVEVSTGSGTDSITLNDVGNDLATISVNTGSGNNDSLTVVRSRATAATFIGGGGSGDVLVRSQNVFGTQTIAGFETVA